MAKDIKYAATQVGDIAYVDRGDGPVALFVHGVFLNNHLWRHVIDRVADMRRCIAIDLLAHGATRTSPDQDVDFTAQAAMLEAVCAALELDQVDLVANDSGGGISQIFAALHPERVRTLTLTNSDTHDNWPPEPFRPLVQAAAQGQLGQRGRRMVNDTAYARTAFARAYEDPEKVSDDTLRNYLAPLYATPESTRNLERFVAAQDCRHTVAIEPLLRRLEAPTVVVWGTDDIFFPVKWAYWLRDTIPGCRKVIEVDGARLFFPEERPEALVGPMRQLWSETRSRQRVADR
jgi:pimeloyl-ACP methyl ester carboxylesterase